LIKSMFQSSWLAVLAILCCVPCAFGQGSVGITLTSGGPYVMNGIYVGPYTGSVNGQSTQIICDDFKDDSFINESWTANVTNFSNLGSSSTPKWSSLNNSSTLYADAAWLASQMLLPANQNTTTEGYLAYALWSLFNPNGLAGLNSTQLAGVEGWLSAIPSGLTPSQFANFFIYTPNTSLPITCSGGPCPTIPPQEFFGFLPAPEGGSALLYLLLAAASCFGAFLIRSRRPAEGRGIA